MKIAKTVFCQTLATNVSFVRKNCFCLLMIMDWDHAVKNKFKQLKIDVVGVCPQYCDECDGPLDTQCTLCSSAEGIIENGDNSCSCDTANNEFYETVDQCLSKRLSI